MIWSMILLLFTKCKRKYKNFNNTLNLCHHLADFGITARCPFFEYCQSNIQGINFIKIKKQHLAPVKEMLFKRFESGRTIPGTRSFHNILPLSEGKVTYKRISDDEVAAGTFQIKFRT